MSKIEDILFQNSKNAKEETNSFIKQTEFLNTVPPKLNLQMYSTLSNKEFSFTINGET